MTSTRSTAAFCYVCVNLDYERFDVVKPDTLASTTPDSRVFDYTIRFRFLVLGHLESSAESGCIFCKIILEGIRKLWGMTEGKELNDIWDSRIGIIHGAPPCFCLELGTYTAAVSYATISERRIKPLTTYTSPDPGAWPTDDYNVWRRGPKIEFVTLHGAQQFHPSFRASVDYNSPKIAGDATELISKWLRVCSEEHHQCGSQDSSQALPKRLICVSGNPYLLDTQDTHTLDNDAAYVTLSHCWGTSEAATRIIKTTSSTLQRFKTGVPWIELPRLFQDAIALTRALGYKYIWIDSLCIIQDDEDDWRAQSSAMAQVYSGAHLNIAAMGMHDSSGTLFGERMRCVDDFFTDGDVQELSDITPAGMPTVWARRCLTEEHDYLYMPDVCCTPGSSYQAPLLHRAWVFQERLLSQRTVYFGNAEILWDCRTSYFCECGYILPRTEQPERFRTKSGFRSDRVAAPKKAIFSYLLSHSSIASQVMDYWMEVVEEYTSLDLSIESDRSVALIGLASRLAQAKGLTYMEGLWLEDIPRCLIWTAWIGVDSVFELWRDRHDSKPSHAFPSWSWLSTASKTSNLISYYDGKDSQFRTDDRLKVLSLGRLYNNKKGEMFGQVISGQLTIQVAFVTGTLRWNDLNNPREQYWMKGSKHVVVETDHPAKGSKLVLQIQNIAIEAHNIESTDIAVAEVFMGHRVWCLLLGAMMTDEGVSFPAHAWKWEALVVHECKNRPRHYFRLGIGVVGPIPLRERDGELAQVFTNAKVGAFTLI